MKKAILFKIGTFPLLSETFVVSQIILACNLGYDVKILINELADFEASRQEELIKKYFLDRKVVIEDYKIPKRSFIKLIKFSFLIIKNWNNIGQVVRYYQVKEKKSLTHLFQLLFYNQFKGVDIVHIQYGTNSKPIDDLKKAGIFRMPVITTFHGHDAFFPINGFIPKSGYYDKLFEATELFTANTPYLHKQLISIDCPKEKITTIPVPVDTSFFFPKEFSAINMKMGLRLLSVGRLEVVKGHSIGIEIVAKLIKEGFNVYYDIVGEGKSRHLLELIIKRLDLVDRIHLLGAMSHDEVREKYWNSDIFLMTSIAYSQNIKETQGLVSIEAQACGLPVVAFDSGGVKYTIENGKSGIVCEENNVSQMVDAVKQLVKDPICYKTLALGGPKFVEDNFSTSKVSQVWKNLYLRFMTND